MTTPLSHHQQITSLIGQEANPLSNPDWILYTDGSGYHADGFGGYAATAVKTAKNNAQQEILLQPVGSATCTTVAEMEFQALLHGLAHIFNWYVKQSNQSAVEAALRRDQPVIHWITDREDLALSVWRDPATQLPVYARRKNPHLWMQFSYFEPMFRIAPRWYHRETLPMHTMVDKLASEARINMQEYIGICQLDRTAIS